MLTHTQTHAQTTRTHVTPHHVCRAAKHIRVQRTAYLQGSHAWHAKTYRFNGGRQLNGRVPCFPWPRNRVARKSQCSRCRAPERTVGWSRIKSPKHINKKGTVLGSDHNGLRPHERLLSSSALWHIHTQRRTQTQSHSTHPGTQTHHPLFVLSII